MFRKSFISIFFLPKKLLVLQLNSSGKKVKKYASVELPEGLIKGYRVQNVNSLANILKNLWSKLHLKEKSLGIVIPEFSTFTKLLSLPKLTTPELDEAIRWQVQEYLPSSLDKVVMDWKIVERKEAGYEVLVVTMEKNVLTGYVKACELAGLFPLAVETPSLCLVRALEAKDSLARLILHKSHNEAVLVVATGDKIFGTSVLHTDDSGKIASVASKMKSHFKAVKLEKIVVSGLDIDDVLVENLEKMLGEKMVWIKPKIEGFSEKGIQEYLIPLYMQLNDLQDPSDPNSLNLLPPELVEKYRKAKLRVQIWSLTLTVTLFVWVSFLITLGAYLFMSQQISDQKEKNLLKKEVSQQRKEAVDEVKKINAVVDKVLKIKDITTSPQELLNNINKAKPQGLRLVGYALDLEKGTIELKGVASNRLVLVEFKKNLEAFPEISLVEIPISSFEVENNLEFTLTFRHLSTEASKK